MKRKPESEHGQSVLYACSPVLYPINTHLFLKDLLKNKIKKYEEGTSK